MRERRILGPLIYIHMNCGTKTHWWSWFMLKFGFERIYNRNAKCWQIMSILPEAFYKDRCISDWILSLNNTITKVIFWKSLLGATVRNVELIELAKGVYGRVDVPDSLYIKVAFSGIWWFYYGWILLHFTGLSPYLV